jgi:hypothetical protein
MEIWAWLVNQTVQNVLLSVLAGAVIGNLLYIKPKNGALIGLGFGAGYSYHQLMSNIIKDYRV